MGLSSDEIVIIVVLVLSAIYGFIPVFMYVAFYKKHKEYAFTTLKNTLLTDPNVYMLAVVWGKQRYTLYIKRVTEKYGSKYLIAHHQNEEHLPNILSMHDTMSKYFQEEEV